MRVHFGIEVLASRAAAVASGVALAMALAGSPVLAEGPAVSGINGKVSGIGGGAVRGDGQPPGDDGGLGGIAGSLTLPLGYSFGLQLDGAWAHIQDGNFEDAGAHLFWRDPGIGLFGVYAGYAHRDDFGPTDFGRAGIEAQYFAGPVTLDGAVGYRFGDVEDNAYGRAKVVYYITEDFALSGGYLFEDRSFGTAGAEYQFHSDERTALSIFADSSINGGDDYAVLGGLRVAFGQNMSLKDRQRRQDPDNYVIPDLLARAENQGGDRQDNSGKGGKCPFKPSTNICFVPEVPSFAKLGSGETSVIQQCREFGFTGGEGGFGPKSCGCEEAFQQCAG